MARKPRVHFPGALYHVISRGNQRQNIFKQQEDFARFQHLLENSQKQFGLRVYAYILMPNHFHLLLEVGSSSLSRAMQSLLCRYSRYYNIRYHKVGHLFQGRYRAILCDKDEYLLELVRYLHLNPVRARLVKDPRDYRWSSHRSYLQGRDTAGLRVEEVLGHFSRQRALAIRAYGRFIRDGLAQGHRQQYYEVKEQRYLGEDDFVERAESRFRDSQELPIKITIPEIVNEVLQHFRGTVSEVRSKRRGRRESLLRAIVAYAGREVGRIALSETASDLGRDLSTVSIAVKRLEEKMREDGNLRQQVENLCRVLRNGRKGKYQIIKA